MWEVFLQSYDLRVRGSIGSSQSDFLDIAFVQYCIIRMNIRHIDRTSNLHSPGKHIKHFQLNFDEFILSYSESSSDSLHGPLPSGPPTLTPAAPASSRMANAFVSSLGYWPGNLTSHIMRLLSVSFCG